MELSADRATLLLDIQGQYSAAELDNLIRALAQQRASMLPAVATTRADLLQSAGDSVLIEANPSLNIAARRNGGFRLWVRNQGLGWLAYEIDNRTAIGVRDLISMHTSTVEGVDLFSDGDGHTH